MSHIPSGALHIHFLSPLLRYNHRLQHRLTDFQAQTQQCGREFSCPSEKANTSSLSVSRMVYWTSLRWCVSYVSYSPCILLFSTRLCVTWHLRSMWSKFSYGRNNFQKLIWTRKQKRHFQQSRHPDHSDLDSDTDSMMGDLDWGLGSWGLNEEVWVVYVILWERNQFIIY